MQHFQNGRIGTVVTVLCPPFGLGNPDRLTVVADRVVDVGRKQLISRELFAAPGDRATHDEALVESHQIADKRPLQQIVANGDARRAHLGLEHRIVDESGVHHDVAVIGDEQIGAARPQLFQAGISNAICGALDGAVEVHLDPRLQRVDRMNSGELTPQSLRYKWFEHPAHGAGQPRKAKMRQYVEKFPVGEQPCHDSGDFSIGVGSDGFEFVHHDLCKGNY